MVPVDEIGINCWTGHRSFATDCAAAKLFMRSTLRAGCLPQTKRPADNFSMKTAVKILCLIFPFCLNAQPPDANSKTKPTEGDTEVLARSAAESGSFRQWVKAARSGHREAQLLVGRVYLDKKKFRQAQPYLRAAAVQGDSEAQGWMGLMYEAEGWGDVRPKGLPNPNPYIACVWFWLSAMSGSDQVDNHLKRIADWDLGRKRFKEAKAEARTFHKAIERDAASGFLLALANQSPPSTFMLDNIRHVAAGGYGVDWSLIGKHLLPERNK
jgi:hypothetical protein